MSYCMYNYLYICIYCFLKNKLLLVTYYWKIYHFDIYFFWKIQLFIYLFMLNIVPKLWNLYNIYIDKFHSIGILELIYYILYTHIKHVYYNILFSIRYLFEFELVFILHSFLYLIKNSTWIFVYYCIKILFI